jgi:hypothetical protein
VVPYSTLVWITTKNVLYFRLLFGFQTLGLSLRIL